MAHADHVARLEHVVAAHALGADDRAVAAFQIAKHPAILREENFGVRAAAALVLHHNLVGRRAAQRYRLPRRKPEHVGPFGSFTNHQIGEHARFPVTISTPAAAVW